MICLDRKDIFLNFIFALALLLIIPQLFSGIRLTFLAPILIIVYYQKSYINSLWISLFCGLSLDFLSFQTHFGLCAVSYCLATAALYGQKRHFFADSLTTMPLMTFFFVILSTIIHSILIYTFEKDSVLSWKWFFTDLLVMPFVDSVYSFAVYILPVALFGTRQRKGKDYFTSRAYKR